MITLRVATVADTEALQALMRRSVAGLSPGYYSAAETRSAIECITVPDRFLLEDGTMFIAVADGAMVGCGAWSARRKLYTGSAATGGDADRLDPEREAARIRAFFVDPDWSGRGIGRALFDACVTAARRAGFRRVELLATLPGVPFYERLDFDKGEPVDIALTDGTKLPGIVMRRSIEPEWVSPRLPV